jgi:hypothetical protein
MAIARAQEMEKEERSNREIWELTGGDVLSDGTAARYEVPPPISLVGKNDVSSYLPPGIWTKLGPNYRSTLPT